MGAAASTRAVGFKEPKPWRKKGTDEEERQRIYPLRSFLLCRCDAICEMEQACCNDERQGRCLRPPIEPSKQTAMPVADPFVLSVCIYAFRRLLCPMQPDQFFASRKTRIRCQEAPTLRWHGDGVFVVSCVCVCLDLLVRPTSRCLCSPMYRGKMRGAHAHTHTRTHAHTPTHPHTSTRSTTHTHTRWLAYRPPPARVPKTGNRFACSHVDVGVCMPDLWHAAVFFKCRGGDSLFAGGSLAEVGAGAWAAQDTAVTERGRRQAGGLSGAPAQR